MTSASVVARALVSERECLASATTAQSSNRQNDPADVTGVFQADWRPN